MPCLHDHSHHRSQIADMLQRPDLHILVAVTDCSTNCAATSGLLHPCMSAGQFCDDSSPDPDSVRSLVLRVVGVATNSSDSDDRRGQLTCSQRYSIVDPSGLPELDSAGSGALIRMSIVQGKEASRTRGSQFD